MANISTAPREEKSIQDVRKNANIMICLPLAAEDSETYDRYEFVTVNGVTTQIKLGEVLGVSWPVYETLKNGRYKNNHILA